LKRLGCGTTGCGCGCLGLLVVAFILLGGFGVLIGNWAGIAHPSVPTSSEVATIPVDYLVLYEQTGARFGLDWQVLAAIGEVETNHGRNAHGCAPNAAGARGPMQFLPDQARHLQPGRRHPGRRGLSRLERRARGLDPRPLSL
jgi:hypothetical protein